MSNILNSFYREYKWALDPIFLMTSVSVLFLLSPITQILMVVKMVENKQHPQGENWPAFFPMIHREQLLYWWKFDFEIKTD